LEKTGMKFFSLMLFAGLLYCTPYKDHTYEGSTPVESAVRTFFGISLTDSIDFMRWKLTLRQDVYDLSVEYGLAKNSTPGFTNRKEIVLTGKLKKEGNYYYLINQNKTLYVLSINDNLLHLLDEKKSMLVGNGGYSYGLSNTNPVKTDGIKIPASKHAIQNLQVYEGRTPCQELSASAGLNRRPECDKLKWYMILYADPVTHQPTYYLKGGRSFPREKMEQGKWKISNGVDGRIFYTLSPDNQPWSFNLVQLDDNILVFTDKLGNPLVGNENFSYVLNRKDEHPTVR
jgi:hypothetical protein